MIVYTNDSTHYFHYNTKHQIQRGINFSSETHCYWVHGLLSLHFPTLLIIHSFVQLFFQSFKSFLLGTDLLLRVWCDLYVNSLYFSTKNGGSPLKCWRGVISNFENVSNERRFNINVPKISVKCFFPLTKVYIIHSYYDHNILHYI